MITKIHPYVILSGLGGNAIFAAANKDRCLILCVQIPLIYEYLFYKYFVWKKATKDKYVHIYFKIVERSYDFPYFFL